MNISRRNRNIKAGFSRAIPLRLLADGTYHLKIQLVSVDKKTLFETQQLLTIIKLNNNIEVLYTYNYIK
jgi:hypothetical protein